MVMHSAVNQTVGVVPDRLAEPGNPFSLRAPVPYILLSGVYKELTTIGKWVSTCPKDRYHPEALRA